LQAGIVKDQALLFILPLDRVCFIEKVGVGSREYESRGRALLGLRRGNTGGDGLGSGGRLFRRKQGAKRKEQRRNKIPAHPTSPEFSERKYKALG
jgi:hypothetical protein